MTVFAPALLMWMALGAQDVRPDPAPPSAGWITTTFPDGVELRFVPPAVGFEDYPEVAIRNGVEGTSLLSLQVDPSGQITGCTTARSAGLPALDEQACLLYRTRARFELRGATQPVTLQAPVMWKLED